MFRNLTKLLSIFFLLIFHTVSYSQEEFLRIGGLDITPNNYGSIRIGPHKDLDSLATAKNESRFANYYFELSVWANGTINDKNLVSDADVGKGIKEWYPFQKVQFESSENNNKNKGIYTTVFRDDRQYEAHQPLGLEIKQEIHYEKNRDWAILFFSIRNLNSYDLDNFSFGLKLDADVPNETNFPTNDDDLAGQSENLIYLYDKNLTVEKSNIVGLQPLGDNNTFTFNWWNVEDDPSTDQERSQYIQTSLKNYPTISGDYRIMVSQGPFYFKSLQEINFTCALIESKGLKNAQKAQEESKDYYYDNLVKMLKKLPPKIISLASNIVPERYALSQNYPNPFNPTTTITYSIPKDNDVILTIYNTNGEIVNTLVNIYQKSGNYKVVWNGINHSGNRVSSGLYYYKLKAGDFSSTRKMIFLQ